MSETVANRLAREKSPYLLQHAYNPVDWYPWGEEAFNKAREEDKPIFLSIGYSTCHWCHVMEKESFEDLEVAQSMNETFVSIKVDREERPDIDNVYMAVAQAMTGRGGWPLTIIMTADKKPFFSGTYFPKNARFGQIGMLELTERIKEIWLERRQEVYVAAEQLTSTLNSAAERAPQAELESGVLHDAFARLAERFDSEYGGFGHQPKFPTPHNLSFLLRYWKRSGNVSALRIAEATLQAMSRGGICDQVGSGFHRYSTDRQWLVPHFEKMLYDQALLAIAYLEAYQVTGNDLYADTARDIFVYVLRDMTDVGGGFYSAEDADSEGEEGRFYLWTREEIAEVLDQDDSHLALKVFDVQPAGNFAEPLSGDYTGANILHLVAPYTDLAAETGVDESVLRARLEDIRSRLFARRAQRVRPHRDDKIIADWNGLMVAALARGAQVLGEPRYAQAAAKAADFILDTLRDDNGRLVHRYRDGDVLSVSYLDDYAFLVWGLIELYEATFEVRYLQTAMRMNEEMLSLFWDDGDGALFLTTKDSDELIFRPKEAYDGAVPSGNSVAALNLMRLGRLTGSPELEERAAGIWRYFSNGIHAAPMAHTQMLQALDFAFGPSYEIVIAGDPKSEDTRAMLRAILGKFLPNKVLLLRDATEDSPEITKIAGFTADTLSIEGRSTAYVCRNFACKSPTSDINEMLSYLA